MNEIFEYVGSVDELDCVIALILMGHTIEKKGVSICDLRKIMPEYRNLKEPMIQVTCNRMSFSEIMKNPRAAAQKYKTLVAS